MIIKVDDPKEVSVERMAKRELSIEKAFEELDKIISKLESEDTKLKDSIELYGKGVKLLDECQGTLEQVEKQMIMLNGDGEQDEL